MSNKHIAVAPIKTHSNAIELKIPSIILAFGGDGTSIPERLPNVLLTSIVLYLYLPHPILRRDRGRGLNFSDSFVANANDHRNDPFGVESLACDDGLINLRNSFRGLKCWIDNFRSHKPIPVLKAQFVCTDLISLHIKKFKLQKTAVTQVLESLSLIPPVSKKHHLISSTRSIRLLFNSDQLIEPETRICINIPSSFQTPDDAETDKYYWLIKDLWSALEDPGFNRSIDELPRNYMLDTTNVLDFDTRYHLWDAYLSIDLYSSRTRVTLNGTPLAPLPGTQEFQHTCIWCGRGPYWTIFPDLKCGAPICIDQRRTCINCIRFLYTTGKEISTDLSIVSIFVHPLCHKVMDNSADPSSSEKSPSSLIFKNLMKSDGYVYKWRKLCTEDNCKYWWACECVKCQRRVCFDHMLIASSKSSKSSKSTKSSDLPTRKTEATLSKSNCKDKNKTEIVKSAKTKYLYKPVCRNCQNGNANAKSC